MRECHVTFFVREGSRAAQIFGELAQQRRALEDRIASRTCLSLGSLQLGNGTPMITTARHSASLKLIPSANRPRNTHKSRAPGPVRQAAPTP